MGPSPKPAVRLNSVLALTPEIDRTGDKELGRHPCRVGDDRNSRRHRILLLQVTEG